MAKREKTNMVTRRVVESRTYDIYEVNGDKFTKLDTIAISGRVKEKELAEKYGVEKVTAIEIAVNKKVYGVPIDKFMELAVEVATEN